MSTMVLRCLSSCSYIKPQRGTMSLYRLDVVYHLVPTSNHNWSLVPVPRPRLFIILFLHQTTTSNELELQPWALFIILFLHQTTTLGGKSRRWCMLFIILFLHQTTTILLVEIVGHRCLSSCSYIKPQPLHYLASHGEGCLSSCSYIKPQLKIKKRGGAPRCLSSCSYIKPQPFAPSCKIHKVVYHLVPTSNHNLCSDRTDCEVVVYHLVPTSNHNL